MEQGAHNDMVSLQEDTQSATQGFNLSPMLYPNSMGEVPQGTQQFPMQSLTQVGFPFNMTHSSNFLLIPARQKTKHQVFAHCDAQRGGVLRRLW